jgi:hypothetical protein
MTSLARLWAARILLAIADWCAGLAGRLSGKTVDKLELHRNIPGSKERPARELSGVFFTCC